ncbi:alpha/beta hydrolase [Roseobacter sp. YSTF-M11]|uniref:Alpha/beta hydrolase n=1 Tax=Roseobacter insulae TaxID=2859783 RepID=A0A9X1G053_9RHOB|nr:alpha/beta hydrolase [Roseobacter insulae]MBW4710827.1 alpha/beta hydrolase [Roseobacter insulae]
MFEGFTEEVVSGDGTDIFLRHSGPREAPGLLLLHGYPQTSAMWHLVAPMLTTNYHVVCPDLRGYGRSGKPDTDEAHAPYSKRAMAHDMIKIMDHFGHNQFFLGAHDRGARVSHRLALDFEDRVNAMVLLDIAPTREMYRDSGSNFATAYWHWFFLIQQHPLPEQMIGNDPEGFWKLKCFNQAKGGNPFSDEALAEYLDAFRSNAAIHASCEDYRAAATIDIQHDNDDGARKLATPTRVFWARRGTIAACFDALALWRERASHIDGEVLDATHYMAEEIPEDIAKRMADFFGQHRAMEAAE